PCTPAAGFAGPAPSATPACPIDPPHQPRPVPRAGLVGGWVGLTVRVGDLSKAKEQPFRPSPGEGEPRPRVLFKRRSPAPVSTVPAPAFRRRRHCAESRAA